MLKLMLLFLEQRWNETEFIYNVRQFYHELKIKVKEGNLFSLLVLLLGSLGIIYS